MLVKEKYEEIFLRTFPVKKEDLDTLRYRGIAEWDSLAHMDLVVEIEDAFKIQMSSMDVLDFSTYRKGLDILAQYGIQADDPWK